MQAIEHFEKTAQDQAQYDEMKPIAESLIDLSEVFIKSMGNFVPHGGAISDAGVVETIAACPGDPDDAWSATEILPYLHSSLQNRGALTKPKVLAVCESVSIDTGNGLKPAIKVLAEHRDGLNVAFYAPWSRSILRRVKIGKVFTTEVDAEIPNWRAP